jgi:hypothetical protein
MFVIPAIVARRGTLQGCFIRRQIGRIADASEKDRRLPLEIEKRRSSDDKSGWFGSIGSYSGGFHSGFRSSGGRTHERQESQREKRRKEYSVKYVHRGRKMRLFIEIRKPFIVFHIP